MVRWYIIEYWKIDVMKFSSQMIAVTVIVNVFLELTPQKIHTLLVNWV